MNHKKRPNEKRDIKLNLSINADENNTLLALSEFYGKSKVQIFIDGLKEIEKIMQSEINNQEKMFTDSKEPK